MSKILIRFFLKNLDTINFSLIFFIFSALMYLNLLRYYIPITEQIVPWGDPFTYEMSYYKLLNIIKSGEINYAIAYIFGSNWYWLQKILIGIFSPFLVNEPYSLCIINFFTYSVASILFFILLIELNCKKETARLLSILIWFYPINYNFTEYSSFPMMGLDSTFLGALYCLIFSYLTFLIRPDSLKYKISFSIFLCAALIGRGNSITVMGVICLVPTILFFYKIFKDKNYQLLKNFLLPAIIFLTTIATFYSFQLKHILNYYSIFKGFFSNDFNLVFPYLKHVPGIFFIYPHPAEINLMKSTDIRLLSISLFCHIINFYSYLYLRNYKKYYIKYFLWTGLFIFYFTFITNLFMWMHPHINIYNAQLIWAPMRIGFVLVISGLVLKFLSQTKIYKINYLSIFLFTIVFFVSNNSYQNQKDRIFENKIDSSPLKIKNIEKFIKNNSDEKRSIILWYGPYLNPRILNYYSLKNNTKEIKYFRGKYADQIWNQSFTGDEYKAKVRNEIENIFNSANLIIINEDSDNYIGPYAFYRYKNFITEQIKNKKLNKFRIVAEIKSSRGKLLVFKRQEKQSKNFDYQINSDGYKFIYQNIENVF